MASGGGRGVCGISALRSSVTLPSPEGQEPASRPGSVLDPDAEGGGERGGELLHLMWRQRRTAERGEIQVRERVEASKVQVLRAQPSRVDLVGPRIDERHAGEAGLRHVESADR